MNVNINNLNSLMNINKCTIHNYNFVAYCLNCKLNLCLYCLKENNEHDFHEIKNYIELIPTRNKIDNLKKKFEEKVKHTYILIEKINNWEREIIRKTEELKQNLKDEISLLKKIINYYNNSYVNYSYCKLFYSIDNYIKDINNEYLIKFNSCYDFSKQTEILSQLYKFIGKKEIEECIKMKRSLEQNYIGVDVIKRIKDIYYLDYFGKKEMRLCFYQYKDNSTYFIGNSIFKTKEKIYSISISTIENKILVCLSDIKYVIIFDYDLKNGTLKLNENEIRDYTRENNHFYKCIQIIKKNFITSDNKYITIWSNRNQEIIKMKVIEIHSTTFDILLANNEYFISSQPFIQEITLYSVHNYKKIKRISKIDSLNSTNSLIKIKNDYIIINCTKGIALFYIKTKDIVQYLENYYSNYKNITYDGKNNIYVLSMKKNESNGYNIKIILANIICHEFKLIKEYEEIPTSHEKLDITCLDDNILLLWNDNVYISKEI